MSKFIVQYEICVASHWSRYTGHFELKGGWNEAEVKAQLKWRNPSATGIKIVDHKVL